MGKQKDDDEKLDRRAFFRLGLRKTAKAASQVMEQKAEHRAKRFIRPPFAIGELDFLLRCTRCDACIDACPQEIIFPLSVRLGVDLLSTPALDLQNGACELCADWPCVSACEPRALKLPEPPEGDETKEEDPRPLPQLAMARIDEKNCLPFSGPECGACGSVCPVPGAISWDMTRPVINKQLCTGCALCRQACITAPKAIIISHKPS